MTTPEAFLSDAMAEALKGGDTIPPTMLVDTASAMGDPFDALSKDDLVDQLYVALAKEFDCVNLARVAPQGLQTSERERLIALLRWTISELRQWRPAADPQHAHLVALLVVAGEFDGHDQFWSLLPDDIGFNTDFIKALMTIVTSMTAAFIPRGPGAVPLWESEAIEAFKRADIAGDWASIEEALPRFEAIAWPNALQTQAVRGLARYSLAQMAEAVSSLRQTFVAVRVASALTIAQALMLAESSDNPWVQFACTRHATGLPKGQSLGASEQQSLVVVLQKVIADQPRWDSWMRAFNTYPIRVPALQASLGEALATAPDDALASYVNSIWLYSKSSGPDAGRACVTECLQAFASKAAAVRRARMWTLAHERWLAWNFDQVKGDHLLETRFSDLDFAIVGYALECLDDVGRPARLDEILEKLATLDANWHASYHVMIATWHRLLSQFQPFAHAFEIKRNAAQDWLLINRTYLPFDPQQNGYFAMKYRPR
ncbi:MAG: hypothetical protein K2Y27_01220 [Xanthobacteraceae bacterium]|nr:hypothetical protein [Xanthobacteraceae bacterium]